jgi:hypothetical protein
MENEKYLKDITEIKNMMNQSSRFISLSGLSGVLAGIYSLIGAWYVYDLISFDNKNLNNYLVSESDTLKLSLTALSIIIVSLITAIILSTRKAKRSNDKVWNASSKRLVVNFAIPLLTGGFFIIFLIEKEFLVLVAPLTLIFYGLACVNASKYTLGDVRYLGITMIILGLISLWFLNFGILFWALGFGVCHILYGGIMYFKYDKN